MSGDVQPRKRKDKKKKKETSEEIPVQSASAQISNDDVNIHVHKESTTGGEFCANFIFFIVMAVIAVVIGLAIVEYRGQTDLDTLSTESRFAPLFEGWIDKSQGDHGHEDDDDVPVEYSEEIEEVEHEEDKPDEEQEDVEGSEEEQEEANSQPENDDDDDDVNKNENTESEEAEEEQQEEADIDEDEINQADASEEENQSEEADDNLIDDEKDENDEVDEDEERNSILDDLTQTGVVAGFGAVLLVVITLLVRKWKSGKEQAEYLNREALRDLYRRNTLIPPPKIEVTEADEENEPPGLDKTAESDEDGDEEEEEEEEEELEETKSSGIARPPITGVFPSVKKYEDGDEGDDEEADSNEEKEEQEGDSDEELMKKLEAKYGKLPSRQANDSEEEEDDEEDDKGKRVDDDEDDEDKSWKRVKVLPDDDDDDDDDGDEVVESESDEDKAANRRRSGAQSFYTFANITNEDDYVIRDDLDDADKHQEDNIPLALSLYTKILEKRPNSPRALYGKAQALDMLADKRRSNEILQDSVKFYSQVLKENNVPDPLFKAAAERCINRMRFEGQYGKAVAVHKLLIDRFPSNVNFRNQLAVTYLTINRIPEARQNLLDTLQKWPNDGFTLVHYGFILKTVDNDLEKAVDYLRRGLVTREDGVVDGRFYFHLGDSLARLGKKDEAMKVYEEGVDNHVFLSKYQRSLYNVNHLIARPWWDKNQTPYKKFYDDLELNWKVIRDEGLTALNSRGYFKDESENLRDVGDWKQFELYARGIKHIGNCNKCPNTCKIIDTLPEARTCKRGQVKFSVMHPGTHVWPHCGPTNCRLRIHLGLKVPPNTSIRVAEDTRSWEEGKILIFDDSFEHEVWHNGTEFRLVLIVDVWHPELTQREQQSLSAI